MSAKWELVTHAHSTDVNQYTMRLAVPGGWLYTHDTVDLVTDEFKQNPVLHQRTTTSVFVPKPPEKPL